jgi:hypothetical protein
MILTATEIKIWSAHSVICCNMLYRIEIYQTTRRNISEKRYLNTHRCENLKPHILIMWGEATLCNVHRESRVAVRHVLTSKRRPHFKTHKWFLNEGKYGHGSRRGPKPRMTALPAPCYRSAGFEGFTAVVMKGITFWDITPCSPLGVNRRFEGIFRLHL